MSNCIVETVGKWGVVHTIPGMICVRYQTPKAGDFVDLTEVEEYPFNHSKMGRLEKVNNTDEVQGFCGPGEAHLCCEVGSAHLNKDASVTISGGPFALVKISQLQPTFTQHVGRFWNWGNNGAGGGRGVDYYIARPVFKLVKADAE